MPFELGMSLARSMWALSYATASLLTLVITWVAIAGAATKSRTVNIVLCLLCNHLSELPLTIMFTDACFYTWLNITGTFQESILVRFFYYINIITAVALLYLFRRSFEVQEAVQTFLNQLSKESKEWVELPGLTSPRFWQQLLNPFHWPWDCTLYQNIPYWVQEEQLSAQKTDGWHSVAEMELDIYKPNSIQGGDNTPVLFYIHGGGWTHGSKSLIGPLLTEMVSHDWIVVAINYRTATKAGYPTQLIDCKRALRWVKDEIQTFGGDSNNIVVAGDAAGGQLASLLAMTPNLPEYQPGFEKVDTTVQGCIAMSADLDLVDAKNYSNHDARGRFISAVAKRSGSAESAENLKFLAEHSPRFRIKESGVPFLVVHGDIDTLTPVQNARDFVHEFRNNCRSPISYLEVPGGHHCFHLISSPRSWYATIATAAWLNYNFGRVSEADTKGSKRLAVHELVEWGWTV